MLTKLFNRANRLFWVDFPQEIQKTLFNLLGVWLTSGIIIGIVLFLHLVFPQTTLCTICDLLLFAVAILAIVCTLNGRVNCAINIIFMLPVFIYGYYISEFSNHLPPVETVQYTAWWMIGGLVFLYFFSENDNRIILFFVLSLLTVSLHLFFAGVLLTSFTYFNPLVSNPLFVLTAFFLASFFFRKKLINRSLKLKEELHEFQVSLNRVLQASPFMISRIVTERDEDGNVVKMRIAKVNTAFESAFKRNAYELVDQEAEYVFNLIFKEKLDVNKLILFNKRKTTEFHAAEMNKWFKIHVINPAYNIYYLIFEDISRVKEKIAELEASKRRYKVLLEAIPDIFFVIDKDGVYEDFVIKESDLFKMEDVNIIGSSIFEAGFPDNLANKIYSCIHNCIKTDSIESIEYSLNTPNGTFLFEMRLAKLSSHSVISVARDITKRKTAEFQLEKALSRAEQSDRLKSAFLSNLSHEIRTPMNIITHFTRMLADAELNSFERLELTDAISANGKQLLNMIDNTIHLSKIETDSIEVNAEFCKINPILREVYNKFAPHIPDSRDVRIRLNLDVQTSEFGFETDSGLLTETLTILLDNALKYTLTGTINIGYEMVRNDFVKFIISDTGIGIPKEDYENIFSRFYRVSNTINQNTSGSGIGLSIAQHYVALLGGELLFESKVDKGTEFWFNLPFQNGKGYMMIVK